ncbi:hypothetical protein Peur_029373 [Populus x canadensis]
MHVSSSVLVAWLFGYAVACSCAGCLWCSWFALCCLVVLCWLLFLSLLFWGQGVVLVVDGQRDLGLGWYAGSQLAGLLANLAASLGWLAAVCSSLWIERVAGAVYFFQLVSLARPLQTSWAPVSRLVSSSFGFGYL